MSLGHVHIGTSGWHYRHWYGPFYPEKLPAGKMLEFYSRHFDTVELNNTFYGESTFVPENYNGLNKVNAALSLSFYYRFAKRWQFSAHLDHDMLATHKDDLSTAFLFDESFNYQDKFVNGRLTSLSLALGFILKQNTLN